MKKKIILISFFISIFTVSYGQVIDFNMDSALKKYSFIHPDSAYLHDDSTGLHSFYEKLYKLQSTRTGKVSIVHIGDSHVQADFYTGDVRQHFHLDFGNAGRGLIFPYRLARSNEPFDYKTTSPVKWQSKRNLYPDDTLPMGVAGYTIQTFDTSASISVWLKGQHGIDYSMNRLTLFHDRNLYNFDFSIYDSLHHEIAYINMLSKSNTPFTSVVELDKAYDKFIVKPCPKDSSQRCARIFGMLVENGKPGVLYNAIGVNGAQVRNYIESSYFIDQMSYLKPDLVILSLGTNESLNGKNFSMKTFYKQIDSLVRAIQEKNPGVCILLTTPGDAFKRSGRRGRVKNPDIIEIRNVIVKYATEHDLAWWDWFAGCGGWGSMAKWYSAGMADKFRIHYSIKGYQIQGELFYKAIMKGYAKYVKSVR